MNEVQICFEAETESFVQTYGNDPKTARMLRDEKTGKLKWGLRDIVTNLIQLVIIADLKDYFIHISV